MFNLQDFAYCYFDSNKLFYLLMVFFIPKKYHKWSFSDIKCINKASGCRLRTRWDLFKKNDKLLLIELSKPHTVFAKTSSPVCVFGYIRSHSVGYTKRSICEQRGFFFLLTHKKLNTHIHIMSLLLFCLLVNVWLMDQISQRLLTASVDLENLLGKVHLAHVLSETAHQDTV